MWPARSTNAPASVPPTSTSPQFYENFTGQVLMAIEDFGFCERGGGGRFVEEGNLLWPDGALPSNTSGGNLAEANVHGFEMVVEGVRQIRGDSTAQVEGRAALPGRRGAVGLAVQRAHPFEVGLNSGSMP